MKSSRKLKPLLLSGILIPVLVWLFEFLLIPGVFNRFDAYFYDIKMNQSVQMSETDVRNSTPEIVVVDIDSRSVNKLGKYFSWPRSYWKSLIDNIASGKPLAIGIDVIFDKETRNPAEDKLFLKAVHDAGNVYMAVYLTGVDTVNFLYPMTEYPDGYPPEDQIHLSSMAKSHIPEMERIEPDFGELARASKHIGHVVVFPETDGVIRSIYPFYRFNSHIIPSFGMSIIMDILDVKKVHIDDKTLTLISDKPGNSREISLNSKYKIPIYFNGRFKSFRYISFYDVLDKKVDPVYFKNKIVLIGSSLTTLFDLRSIPIQEAFPGVEIHANLIYDLLHKQFISYSSPYLILFILILVGFVFSGSILYLKPIKGMIIIIFLLFVYMIISVLLFHMGLINIPDFSIILTGVFTIGSGLAWQYLVEERGRKQIKSVFSHYLSRNVVDVLLKDPDQIKLGGEKKECTVLFSDIENFTTLSESLDAEKLVSLINEYHTEMTECVFDYNGTLDKYEGDAIMAFYGAPIETGNHALQACQTALSMQERLQFLQKKWESEKRPVLNCRIGVNSGTMVVGNMGSEIRFDYTVMGDAVNLGARLESANKAYGTRLMIGEQTYDMVKTDVAARKLDLLQVKGKTKPVFVYELIALKSEVKKEQLQIIQLFEEGFELYLKQQFEEAVNRFSKILDIKSDDSPALTFIRRCRFLISNPPDNSWNGVFTLKTK